MSAGKRFITAFIWTLLAFATINAQSYFLRSTGWGNLTGRSRNKTEAIGFPWLIWKERYRSGIRELNYRALLANISLAVGCGVLVGVVVLWRGRKRSISEDIHKAPSRDNSPGHWQFSLQGMLALMTLCAIVAGASRLWWASPRLLLLLIFALGPLLIVLLAYWSRNMPSRLQTPVMAFSVTGMAIAAAWIGTPLDLKTDPTRVLLRLYVCWIPQCALLAMIALIWRSYRQRPLTSHPSITPQYSD